MQQRFEQNLVTLIATLDGAEKLVVFAARIHRANQQPLVRRSAELPEVYQELPNAAPPTAASCAH